MKPARKFMGTWKYPACMANLFLIFQQIRFQSEFFLNSIKEQILENENGIAVMQCFHVEDYGKRSVSWGLPIYENFL